MKEVVVVRNNLMVDPQLHVWGWEIPVYLFLGGVTAGVMILSALLALRRSDARPSDWARWVPFAAPVLLSLGMLALLLDLSHKSHLFRFYLAFRPTAPMSWGAWILLAIYPATLLQGLAALRDDEVERLAAWGPVRALRLGRLVTGLRALATRSPRRLQWTNLALGVALGIYTGILLAALGDARPAWNSAVLGPLFLVSGFSTGAAAMMLLPLGHAEHALLRRWDMLAIGVELGLLLLLFLSFGTGGAVGRETLGLFFGGPFTALFWALVVLAGLAAPFLIELIEAKKALRPTLLAPALLLVGGLALRWIFVAAGQA